MPLEIIETPTVQVHFKINDGVNFYEDTLVFERSIFDAMTEQEKEEYVNDRFETWKAYILNPNG